MERGFGLAKEKGRGMTIKFGGKPTIRDKMKSVEKRLGATTGASKGKGKAPPPKPKIKPTGSLKKPGVKVTWRW